MSQEPVADQQETWGYGSSWDEYRGLVWDVWDVWERGDQEDREVARVYSEADAIAICDAHNSDASRVLEEAVRALQDVGRCIICKGDGSPQCVTCHDYQTCQCTQGYGRYADKCWACKGTGFGDSRIRDCLEKLQRLQQPSTRRED